MAGRDLGLRESFKDAGNVIQIIVYILDGALDIVNINLSSADCLKYMFLTDKRNENKI